MITRKKMFAIFVLISLLNTVNAQVNHHLVIPSSPTAADMSEERLQRIDTVLQQALNDKWTNGAEALIIRHGKIIYNKSFGYNDLEKKIKMPDNGIFRIASQTKAVTSVAIMMLYEEGKLLLDDPVSMYIPSFKNPVVLDHYNEKDTTYTTVPAKSEITILHLLTHTSGIAYAQIGGGPSNSIYAKNNIISGLGLEKKLLADNIKKLAALPLMHNPGEQYTYGLNTDVLGYIVEIVSGMSLDEFFHKRLFEPLGMKDTYFQLGVSKFFNVNALVKSTCPGYCLC